MSQGNDLERVYQELRRRTVARFGKHSAAELESYPGTAAEKTFDVDDAEVHPDLEPLYQE